MQNLKEFNIKELGDLMKSMGESSYRAPQIFRWIWQKGECKIDNFSDISKRLRDKLKEKFDIKEIELVEARRSIDGSHKFIFKLDDSSEIETVYIPDGDRKTVCVSSQVGCPLACKFCATGMLLRYRRNLKAWEIADQVMQVKKFMINLNPNFRVTNVVFMGMGEPMLNMEEVLKSIEILTSHIGPNIGARKITVSTVGIPEGILKLAEFERQVKLAVSLHTAIQEKREHIMPVAKKYPLTILKNSLIEFQKKKKRWITFEIVHLPGVNDGEEDVIALEHFLSGLGAKINVIPFNPFPGAQFRAPRRNEIERFLKRLSKLPYPVTLRKSRGRDIKGACGQLALLRKNAN